MRSSRLALSAAVVVVGLITQPQWCRAGGPLGPNGSPITTSDYAIDLYQGPVFAGSRVTALSGAYVALAEDVDGDLQNPATPAVRPFFSYSDFDYWLGFGLTFPATLQNVDFFNSGANTQIVNAPDAFVFFTPAVNLQWGELGVGLTVELSRYQLSGQDAKSGQAQHLDATIPITHLQFAHGIDHNQWVFGVGARLVALSVSDRQSAASFNSSGGGLELGMVYKPERRPLRLGVAFRSAIRTEASYGEDLLPNSEGDVVVSTHGNSGVFLPKSVAMPWDLNFGFTVQFGRPLNHPWRPMSERVELEALQARLRELERENTRRKARPRTQAERTELEDSLRREAAEDQGRLTRAVADAYRAAEQELRALNRHYVQISCSMLLSGAEPDAVGVESFVSQVVNRSGGRVVYSSRIGVEVGVIPDLLKLRGGSYVEPTRFETSTARAHGTFGMDIRLVNWNVFGLWPDDYIWRLGVGGDYARRYSSVGFTIGGWYPRQPGLPEPCADPHNPASGCSTEN